MTAPADQNAAPETTAGPNLPPAQRTPSQRMKDFKAAGVELALDAADLALNMLHAVRAHAPAAVNTAMTVTRETASGAVSFATETVPAAAGAVVETASTCGTIACDAASTVASATGSVIEIAGTATEVAVGIAQGAAGVAQGAFEVAGSIVESAGDFVP